VQSNDDDNRLVWRVVGRVRGRELELIVASDIRVDEDLAAAALELDSQGV